MTTDSHVEAAEAYEFTDSADPPHDEIPVPLGLLHVAAYDHLWRASAVAVVEPSDYGAWKHTYRKGLCWQRPDSPLGYAMKALRRELISRGYGEDTIKPDVSCLGTSFGAAVRALQTDDGLTSDGTLGYSTAHALYAPRIAQSANDQGFPSKDPGPRLLHGVLDLESGIDPAATGPSPDLGMAQIVLRFAPGITEEQAYSPEFAIPWAARKLRYGHDHCGNSWQAGVVSYNVGVALAADWAAAGLPAEGGPTITVGGTEYPAWQWCTLYWSVAKHRAQIF